QSHIRKQPVNDNRFKKDRAKTDLGARIGEDAAEIRKHCRAMETGRRSTLDPSQSEEGHNRHHQTEEAENREYATPAEIVAFTPESDAPTRLPVSATASRRPIEPWRRSTGIRSPISAIATGNIPPATSPATIRMATSKLKLVATALITPAIAIT